MKATFISLIACVATAVVDAQSNFCAVPSDFQNSTTVGGECDISDNGQVNGTRQQLCNNYGYSIEDQGRRCEGGGLDRITCESNLLGRWDQPTCEQIDYYIRQGTAQLTQQQICSNMQWIGAINMLESTCCGNGGGAEFCPPPPVCQSQQDYNGEIVVRGECTINAQDCERYGFYPDGDSDGGNGLPSCDGMPPGRCVDLGGTWRNYTCNDLRTYMAPAILSSNCTGEMGMRINMLEHLCCGGNGGANTCPQSSFSPICQVPSNYTPNAVVMGQCITNGTSEAQTACENAQGTHKEDDGMFECDVDESTCNAMGFGTWVNRTCSDGFFHVNSERFNCRDTPEIPMLIEQHCCSGTPVADSVCGPKVDFCDTDEDFNPEAVFFNQCGLCRDVVGGPNGPNCNSSDLSNQCIDAGGRINWEERDFSCMGDSINESICSGMGGRFEPVSCLQAQIHVSYGMNISDMCADAESAALTQFIPRCCSQGSARSICGEPGQVCENDAHFDNTAALWNQCKFCRQFENDECSSNGEGGTGSPRRSRARRDHLTGSGSGSGREGCTGPDCFNQGCGRGPVHPICANPLNMSRACSLAGGIWDFEDQSCLNITRQQCNAIPVGRWDPIFCDAAPLFIGQSIRSNNMSGRCADPQVRPKFEALRSCCGGNSGISLCNFPTPPPSVRNRVRLFLDFVGRLDDMTDAQQDEFIYRLKTAIVERSNGVITFEDIIRVILTAIAGTPSNRARRQAQDQIRATVDFNQTASPTEIQGAVAVLQAANQQDPLSVEVNGQTYSVSAVTAEDSGAGGGASDLIPIPLSQIIFVALVTLSVIF